MDHFGRDPWHYYFGATLAEGVGLYGLIALVSTLWFIVRHPKHLISWMMIPFIAAHLFIGHKEIRFLFPLLFFAPYFIVVFFRELPSKFTFSKAWRICVIVLAVGNVLLILYALTIPNADVYFRDTMREYSRDKEQVVLLNLKEERTYYSYPEQLIGPREIAMSFYLPVNMVRKSFDRLDQLEAQAAILSAHNPEVFILTSDKELPAHSTLPLEKLNWNPYPGWLVRHFNFNNWIEHSVGSKNVYRVIGPSSRIVD